MDTPYDISEFVFSFEKGILKSTQLVYNQMEQRTEVDVAEICLYSLFFRNCNIFETTLFLLSQNRIVGAELLLRSLFEGTVILEWCLIDPKERPLRFNKNVIEGIIELAENGFFHQDTEIIKHYKDTKVWLDEKNLNGLPNFRQMVESLDTYNKDYAYSLYKYLSKNAHGVCTEWGDFLDVSDERAKVCSVRQPHPKRVLSCRIISLFLQLRNLISISSFGQFFNHDGIEDIEHLQEMWNCIYVATYIDENKPQLPTVPSVKLK